MFQKDLSRILNLSGIRENAQDEFERRAAISKLKQLTTGTQYDSANHTHINPQTGVIIYSRTGKPYGSAEHWNNPDNATASVGLDLKNLLKKAGLEVRNNDKGNARVDPEEFANLGKDSKPTTPPTTGNQVSSSGSGSGKTSLSGDVPHRDAIAASDRAYYERGARYAVEVGKIGQETFYRVRYLMKKRNSSN
jgi:hypothetical protein